MPAPIVLFCYNRPEHLQKTLDALQRNEMASASCLTIYCDGARHGELSDNIVKVRDIAHEAHGFLKTEVVIREENLGCCQSVITGVSEVLEKNDSIIVLEDDIVTSPHFLRYMNDALEHYADEKRVMSIGGYNLPHATLPIPKTYPYDTYLGLRSCSWGWGTWREEWSSVDWSMGYFEDFVKNPAMIAEFNRGGPDLAYMLAHQYNGRINTWDVQFCYEHYAQKKYCVYPVTSFTRNIGLDNSGTHCGPDSRRVHGELEEHRFPLRFCPGDVIDPVLERLCHNAFAPDPPKGWPAFRDRLREKVAKELIAVRRRFKSRQVSLLAVNTLLEGGAAKAALRNFNALRDTWPGAGFLTLSRGACSDPAILGLGQSRSRLARKLARRDQHLLKQYPAYQKDAFFSPGVRYTPVRLPLRRFQPEIVHLNWITGGMLRIEDLLDVDCPIVWTLHDAWAFTGGCHYVGDCERYKDRCGQCPMLGSDKRTDLSRQLVRRKSKVYPQLDLTIVSPSRWLAGQARQSDLFQLRRIEVIPNGLDTGTFAPIEHVAAKAYFHLDPTRPAILFGAQTLTDPRKGGDLLKSSLTAWGKPCTLLTFGEGKLELPESPQVEIRPLGTLHDDASLALAYSAADVFCCPSREDNLPNTMLEALSCGTPCLAFHAGGMAEIVEHRQNGYLAEAFSAEDCAAGLEWLSSHSDPASLRGRAREDAVTRFDQAIMARRYQSLFEELLQRKRR